MYAGSVASADSDCSHAARIGPELRQYAEQNGIDFYEMIRPLIKDRPLEFCLYVERGVQVLRARRADDDDDGAALAALRRAWREATPDEREAFLEGVIGEDGP